MPYEVRRLDVWTGEIEDRPGGLAEKLAPLADAGADLEFVIARRQPHIPGRGVVFLGAVSGTKARRAAEAAGLAPASDMAALRVEGSNKPGTGYKITKLLADEGINLRGLSAGVLGKRFVAFLAFDSADDANRAARLLHYGTPSKGK